MDFMENNIVPGLIKKLCDNLNSSGLDYCHWKSNAALDRSASGENDLDLLVSRADVQRFSEILFRLGFRQAHERPEHLLPGVVDYYGYDDETCRWIHVHTHYQLVLGHDATKNYHIPVEKAYLASSTLNGLFKVPSAEFELIILVIRMVLKHCTWDTLLLHQGKLSSSERNELNYLLDRISKPVLNELLKKHFTYIEPGLFDECLQMLLSGSTAWKRAQTGRKLLNCLTPYARRPKNVDAVLKIWRRFYWPFQSRILRTEDRKQMTSGGLLVAVVGGDGAGKTTVIEEVNRWLREDFEVHKFHMGKPRWSISTVIIRGLIKMGRTLGFYPFMRAEICYTNDADLLVFPGYPWLIREVCTARDRYLTYIKARRLASNGGVVILDRFPLPQIKFMDGPQVARMTASLPSSSLIKSLAHLEESYYQKMALPDVLVVLRADPETAVKRKTDEVEEEVRARSTEIWQIDWSQTSALVVDANRSKEEVLADVKELIWSRM
jgi:thymidylate kinase